MSIELWTGLHSVTTKPQGSIELGSINEPQGSAELDLINEPQSSIELISINLTVKDALEDQKWMIYTPRADGAHSRGSG